MTALAQPAREALDRRLLSESAEAECRDLCATLARRREACRLTRTQLAAQIGTSREMIGHWERGGNPTLRWFARWARGLDMVVVLR
jgi:DNA-binding XRE family transcriptional regulator